MSAKGERFAERLSARMRVVGLRTHDDVRAARGPSSPIMTKLMNGEYERLEPSTAKKLEDALELKPGSATISFEDDVDFVPRPAATVSAPSDDEDTLLYRRPEGITDEKWRQIVARTRSLVQWEIEQALKDD